MVFFYITHIIKMWYLIYTFAKRDSYTVPTAY